MDVMWMEGLRGLIIKVGGWRADGICGVGVRWGRVEGGEREDWGLWMWMGMGRGMFGRHWDSCWMGNPNSQVLTEVRQQDGVLGR